MTEVAEVDIEEQVVVVDVVAGRLLILDDEVLVDELATDEPIRFTTLFLLFFTAIVFCFNLEKHFSQIKPLLSHRNMFLQVAADVNFDKLNLL